MRGKILYLPVATLPPELPPDPLSGCRLWCDTESSGKWGESLHHRLRRRSPSLWQGRLLGMIAAGAAYIAACVIWSATLWALPVAVALGVAAWGWWMV